MILHSFFSMLTIAIRIFLGLVGCRVLLVEFGLYFRVRSLIQLIPNEKIRSRLIEYLEFELINNAVHRLCNQSRIWYKELQSESNTKRYENDLSNLQIFTRSGHSSLKAQIPNMTEEELSYSKSDLERKKTYLDMRSQSEYLKESVLYGKYMDELIDEIGNKASNDSFRHLRKIKFKLEDGSITENTIDFDLINARLKELGYIDENLKATKKFSNRFIAHFKSTLDIESVYKWPSNVETIRDRMYFICRYYDRKFELDNGNVHGSYRDNDIEPHVSNLSYVFDDMYVF